MTPKWRSLRNPGAPIIHLLAPPRLRKNTSRRKLERNCPGASENLAQFLVELATYNVQPDYGTKTLNFRGNTGRLDRLESLTILVTSGEVWFDYPRRASPKFETGLKRVRNT